MLFRSYAYSENYILPYSHDEVVHGKGSMINKMYGAYDEKFASLRTLYGFTMAHPGKKLLFMGGEFAQFVEWRDKEQLDWFLIDQYEMHDSFHKYVAKLNEIYKSEPALYELDQDPAGFEWCLQSDADHSVVAFIRKNKKGRGRKQQQILCVCNFTPMEWDKYKVPLPKKSKLTKILDSSELDFGGDGDVSESKVSTKRVKVPSEGKKAVYQQAAEISLKPLSVVYYKIEEVETKPRKSAAKKAEPAKKATAKKAEPAKNAIDQADKTEDGKSTKKDKSKVFAGDLNLIDDPVTKKRKEAQQKALKVVKDAWDIDRSIDEDIRERRDHYDKMKTLYSEAQDEVLKINDQKKALREQHMVEPDSQEQKDLELLEKRQVCMSGKFNIELTEEEWKRCEEIDKAGLTNYQEQALELNKRSIHFREELKEAQKVMKEDVAKIKAIRLERLKSDPMVEAEKNADQIMENASKEIIGLLKQEAIDNMDEKQQEAEEKAKDTKEEKKEEEKKLEEQKLEREKQEAMMMQTKEAARKVRAQQKRVEASDVDMGEIVTLARDYRQPENVSQTLNEIKNNMKLLEADLKGIQVDEEG